MRLQSAGFLNLANDALQLVADADRIALTEENYAVEGVGNDDDGQLLRLRQLTIEDVCAAFALRVDAKAKVARKVGKFAAAFHKYVVFFLRREEHNQFAPPSFERFALRFNVVEDVGAGLVVGF